MKLSTSETKLLLLKAALVGTDAKSADTAVVEYVEKLIDEYLFINNISAPKATTPTHNTSKHNFKGNNLRCSICGCSTQEAYNGVPCEHDKDNCPLCKHD